MLIRFHFKNEPGIIEEHDGSWLVSWSNMGNCPLEALTGPLKEEATRQIASRLRGDIEAG